MNRLVACSIASALLLLSAAPASATLVDLVAERPRPAGGAGLLGDEVDPPVRATLRPSR